MSAIDLWCENVVPEELGHVQRVLQLLSELSLHLSCNLITRGHGFILNWTLSPHALHLVPVSIPGIPFVKNCFQWRL